MCAHSAQVRLEKEASISLKKHNEIEVYKKYHLHFYPLTVYDLVFRQEFRPEFLYNPIAICFLRHKL